MIDGHTVLLPGCVSSLFSGVCGRILCPVMFVQRMNEEPARVRSGGSLWCVLFSR